MTHRIDPHNRLALLMHGNVVGPYGKMGMGLLRYSPAEIAAVIDRDTAGQDITVLTGIPRPAPIVPSVHEALRLGADILVLGVATPGGVIPADFWAEIHAGLEAGLSLVNGLHAPLASQADLAGRLQPGRFIWDVRIEPPNLPTGSMRAASLAVRRVLTVGTDMAIGKMTAAIEMDRAARQRGWRSRFLASGQIGICIAGEGVALDAVRVDFASGAVEKLVLDLSPDCDVVMVEGQGSLLNPASTAWLPLIRGCCPTDMILSHRVGQTSLLRAPWVQIPPLPTVIALYESICAAGGALPPAKVKGLALITKGLDEEAARRALAEASEATGLPATDVVRFGAGALVDALHLQPSPARP